MKYIYRIADWYDNLKKPWNYILNIILGLSIATPVELIISLNLPYLVLIGLGVLNLFWGLLFISFILRMLFKPNYNESIQK